MKRVLLTLLFLVLPVLLVVWQSQRQGNITAEYYS